MTTACISKRDSDYVPCLFIPFHKTDSVKRLIIYFHGNGDDLGSAYWICEYLKQHLEMNVLAVEYPGYGIYEDSTGASEEKILRDAELVYNFVQDVANVKEKDIFLMGRSIGSGPATHLAAKFNPGCLMLIAPIKSLKSVATNLVGNILG